jgi:NADH-quinone oxidoreductase subunit C
MTDAPQSSAPNPTEGASALDAQLPVQRLRAAFPSALISVSEFRGELTLVVQPSSLHESCELLKSDPDLHFNFLADLSAVDRYPVEPRFEVVYHLLSTATGNRLRLKAPIHSCGPRIDSVYGLWPGADMLEREVFDLFGIHFTGHPRLRRLMMPDDWEGHPLRKDYPVEGPR